VGGNRDIGAGGIYLAVFRRAAQRLQALLRAERRVHGVIAMLVHGFPAS